MKLLVLTDIHNCWTHLEEMISFADELDGVVFLGDLIIHGQAGRNDSASFANLSRIHKAAKFAIGVPGNSATLEVIQWLDENQISVHGRSRIIGNVGFFGVGGSPDPVNLILELRAFFKSEIHAAIELHPKALETLSVFGVTIQDDVFIVEDWTEKQEKELEIYRGPFDHSEEEIYNILVRGTMSLSKCSVRVLLSHIPPYEPIMNSKFPDGVSTGSKGITRFIDEFRPSAVLSGHYHIHHEFSIDSIPCYIFPAVKDGFYSVLSIDQETKNFKVKVKSF